MPIPPAMKRYRGAGASGKLFRGVLTPTRSPGCSCSCTNADPPRPAGSRSTPIR